MLHYLENIYSKSSTKYIVCYPTCIYTCETHLRILDEFYEENTELNGEGADRGAQPVWTASASINNDFWMDNGFLMDSMNVDYTP